MRLVQEGEVTTDGATATKRIRWVSRCESVDFADEQSEEVHIGKFMGWYPLSDGTGNGEIERLGRIGQMGNGDKTPVIITPENREFPEAENT